MRIAQNKQRILYILPIFTEDSAQQIRYKTSVEKGRYSGYIFDSADKAADIAYTNKKDCNGSDTELKLDIYTPSGDTADKRPVIIWVHGVGMRSSADRFFFGRGCSNSGNCDIL